MMPGLHMIRRVRDDMTPERHMIRRVRDHMTPGRHMIGHVPSTMTPWHHIIRRGRLDITRERSFCWARAESCDARASLFYARAE